MRMSTVANIGVGASLHEYSLPSWWLMPTTQSRERPPFALVSWLCLIPRTILTGHKRGRRPS
eukprot:7287361-Prymnesium_polylepis.1